MIPPVRSISVIGAIVLFSALATADPLAELTFAKHFLERPTEKGEPTAAWSRRHRISTAVHLGTKDRCKYLELPSDLQSRMIDADADLARASDGLDPDFFYLVLFIDPYKEGQKMPKETWDARRSELITLVQDASPHVSTQFRKIVELALFDWRLLSCAQIPDKLDELREAILAFHEPYRPFRERLHAIKAKYRK